MNTLGEGEGGGRGGGDYHQRFHRWKDEIYSWVVSQDCPLPTTWVTVSTRAVIVISYVCRKKLRCLLRFSLFAISCRAIFFPADSLCNARELENYFRKRFLPKRCELACVNILFNRNTNSFFFFFLFYPS